MDLLLLQLATTRHTASSKPSLACKTSHEHITALHRCFFGDKACSVHCSGGRGAMCLLVRCVGCSTSCLGHTTSQAPHTAPNFLSFILARMQWPLSTRMHHSATRGSRDLTATDFSSNPREPDENLHTEQRAVTVHTIMIMSFAAMMKGLTCGAAPLPQQHPPERMIQSGWGAVGRRLEGWPWGLI